MATQNKLGGSAKPEEVRSGVNRDRRPAFTIGALEECRECLAGGDDCGCPYELADERSGPWLDGYQAALRWMKGAIR